MPSGGVLALTVVAASFAPASALAQSESVLYSFVAGPDNGDHPYSGLIADKSGNFYGTTENGGAEGVGTVFELSPPPKSAGSSGTWTETTLYVFTNGADGGVPAASLIFDKSGNLYGTTSQGGDTYGNGVGVVFKLSPPVAPGTTWSETTLYAFSGEADGGDPLGGVVFGKKGALYGTASQGGDLTCGPSPSPVGAPVGCGVVYELTPAATGSGLPWTETVLQTFEGENASPPDGQTPSGTLVFDKKRQYIYGTTQAGGAMGFGMVYKLRIKTKSTPSATGSPYFDIYDFGGGSLEGGSGDGQTPYSGVVFNKAGDLFGTAYSGGTNNLGMVFELTPGGYQSQWNENDLFDFNAANGGGPIANVTFQGTTLYGTTAGSGKTAGKYGTIYQLTPGTTGAYTETVLYSFTGGAAGASPTGKLIIRKGAIYGSSLYGGDGKGLGWGTLFRVIP